MDKLYGREMRNAEHFLDLAEEEAKKSTCLERRCGAILVGDGAAIGRGFNSPPGNAESQRRCNTKKSAFDKKVTDKTCCVHAEQRAMMDALKNNRDVSQSIIYFTSVDEGGHRLPSGKPYCTHCSKMSVDLGIGHWVLEHESGIFLYRASEYNSLSFGYKGNSKD